MKTNSKKDLNKIRKSLIKYLERSNDTSSEYTFSEQDAIDVIRDTFGTFEGDLTIPYYYYLNLLKSDTEHFSFDGHNFKVISIPADDPTKSFIAFFLALTTFAVGGMSYAYAGTKKDYESLENYDNSIVTIDSDNAELLKDVYAVYDLDSVNFCIKRANNIETTDNGNREVTYDFCDIKTGDIIKSDNNSDYFAENLNTIYDVSLMEEKDFNITYDELKNEITLDFLLSREPGSDVKPVDFSAQKSLVKKN